MAITGRLDLSVWRNDDVWEFPLRVRGPNLTGVGMRAQIRLAPDTPGPPEVNLETVTNGNAEGIRLASVTQVNGVWVNDVRIRLNKSTRQALPYAGELGQATPLAWAMQIAGRTRLAGSIFILAHVIDSDAAPTDRPPSYLQRDAGLPSAGATLTINEDDVVELVIDGADLLAPLAAQAQDALDRINEFTTGPRGPNGYSAATLAQLRAAPFTDGPLMYNGRVWIGTAGDFSGAGADDRDIVKQNETPLSEGAWKASYAVPSLMARTDGNGDSADIIQQAFNYAITEMQANRPTSFYKAPGVTYTTTPLHEVNTHGIELWGPGSLIEDPVNDGVDFRQRRLVGTAADTMDYAAGREYATTLANVNAARVPLKISLLGDSTTNGASGTSGAITDDNFSPSKLLADMARTAGFVGCDIQNLAVDGSTSASAPVASIRPGDHAAVFNFAINDAGELGDAIGKYYNNMDSALTAFRAAYPYQQNTQIDGTTKDLFLCCPNSVNSWGDGRGQFRLSLMRGVLIQLARKHHGVVVDKFNWMLDSTNGQPWMGEPQPGPFIHPNNLGNDKLWWLVGWTMFREFVGPYRSTVFHNTGEAEPVALTKQPRAFPYGFTIGRAGAGYPVTTPAAVAHTVQQADGLALQTVYGYTPGGTDMPRIIHRINTGAETWGPWSNSWYNFTEQGGWSKGGGLFRGRHDPNGNIIGQGAIAGGAQTAGTALFNIPDWLRPPANDIITMQGTTSTGDPVDVVVLLNADDGQVTLYRDTTATTIFVSALRGVVAGM